MNWGRQLGISKGQSRAMSYLEAWLGSTFKVPLFLLLLLRLKGTDPRSGQATKILSASQDSWRQVSTVNLPPSVLHVSLHATSSQKLVERRLWNDMELWDTIQEIRPIHDFDRQDSALESGDSSQSHQMTVDRHGTGRGHRQHFKFPLKNLDYCSLHCRAPSQT